MPLFPLCKMGSIACHTVSQDCEEDKKKGETGRSLKYCRVLCTSEIWWQLLSLDVRVKGSPVFSLSHTNETRWPLEALSFSKDSTKTRG